MPTVMLEQKDLFRYTFQEKEAFGVVLNSKTRRCLLLSGGGRSSGWAISKGPIPPDALPTTTADRLPYEVRLALEATTRAIEELG